MMLCFRYTWSSLTRPWGHLWTPYYQPKLPGLCMAERTTLVRPYASKRTKIVEKPAKVLQEARSSLVNNLSRHRTLEITQNAPLQKKNNSNWDPEDIERLRRVLHTMKMEKGKILWEEVAQIMKDRTAKGCRVKATTIPELAKLFLEKKSRVAEENKQLKQAQENVATGKSISSSDEVKEHVEGRAAGACSQHTPKLAKLDPNSKKWTAEETKQLKHLVEKAALDFDRIPWDEVAQMMEGRELQACYRKAGMMPTLTKTSKETKRWTKKEIDQLRQTVEKLAADNGRTPWDDVAQNMPGRSVVACALQANKTPTLAKIDNGKELRNTKDTEQLSQLPEKASAEKGILSGDEIAQHLEDRTAGTPELANLHINMPKISTTEELKQAREKVITDKSMVPGDDATRDVEVRSVEACSFKGYKTPTLAIITDKKKRRKAEETEQLAPKNVTAEKGLVTRDDTAQMGGGIVESCSHKAKILKRKDLSKAERTEELDQALESVNTGNCILSRDDVAQPVGGSIEGPCYQKASKTPKLADLRVKNPKKGKTKENEELKQAAEKLTSKKRMVSRDDVEQNMEGRPEKQDRLEVFRTLMVPKCHPKTGNKSSAEDTKQTKQVLKKMTVGNGLEEVAQIVGSHLGSHTELRCKLKVQSTPELRKRDASAEKRIKCTGEERAGIRKQKVTSSKTNPSMEHGLSNLGRVTSPTKLTKASTAKHMINTHTGSNPSKPVNSGTAPKRGIFMAYVKKIGSFLGRHDEAVG